MRALHELYNVMYHKHNREFPFISHKNSPHIKNLCLLSLVTLLSLGLKGNIDLV